MSGYVVPLDPNSLNRFASYDPRYEDELEDIDEEDEDLEDTIEEMQSYLDGEGCREKLRYLLERIPEREADIIDLYFLVGKRQADIATIFGMTQAAVSYRLSRGIKRTKFLLSLPEVSQEQMVEDLVQVMDPIDVRILVSMWVTTCQSVVAQELDLTQGRVRHRFFIAVAKLQELAKMDVKFEPYRDIFDKISSKNFNILREVKLPQWQDRGGDALV